MFSDALKVYDIKKKKQKCMKEVSIEKLFVASLVFKNRGLKAFAHI